MDAVKKARVLNRNRLRTHHNPNAEITRLSFP